MFFPISVTNKRSYSLIHYKIQSWGNQENMAHRINRPGLMGAEISEPEGV